MSSIDRVRYYDGEFLRAFDFNDEQTYHMEMRRRLNRYLHLYGIVHGLNLQGTQDAGVTQVSFLPGMAIDALGREIYVFAPYTLGDNDITTNRITQAATYDVWLRYQKTPSTPPSSGYSNCNQANQYTRWVESFSVLLLQSPSTPFAHPGFASGDEDNPSEDQVGVLLGTVYIDPTSTSGTFSQPQFDWKRCRLLGVIAQRIHTPRGYDALNPPAYAESSPQFQPFSFLNSPSGNLNQPLSPPASLEIMPNIFADQNMIVGNDFPLTTPAGGPTVTINPGGTGDLGNVKISGDLYVQGNVYSLITSNTPAPSPATLPAPAGTNEWVAIGAYVKALLQSGMPAFVASQPQAVMVPSSAPSATSFSVSGPSAPSIIITTNLTSVTSVLAAYAAISGIQLNANVDLGAPVGVYITNVTGVPGPLANQCTINVSYTVTGNFKAGGQPSILSFYLTAMATCLP
jgi:hypothetical protein